MKYEKSVGLPINYITVNTLVQGFPERDVLSRANPKIGITSTSLRCHLRIKSEELKFRCGRMAAAAQNTDNGDLECATNFPGGADVQKGK